MAGDCDRIEREEEGKEMSKGQGKPRKMPMKPMKPAKPAKGGGKKKGY